MKQIIIVCVELTTLTGCASSKVTQTVRQTYTGPRIESITLSPGSGVMGDAIGMKPFNRDFMVVDPQQTSELIGRHNLTEFQLAKSQGRDFCMSWV